MVSQCPNPKASQYVLGGPWMGGPGKGWSRFKRRETELFVVSHLPDASPFPKEPNKNICSKIESRYNLMYPLPLYSLYNTTKLLSLKIKLDFNSYFSNETILDSIVLNYLCKNKISKANYRN